MKSILRILAFLCVASAQAQTFDASKLVQTDAGKHLVSYGGTSCTNSFIRSLSVLGIATCNQASLTADVTGTLPFANGGFGFSTASQGDVFYASAANTPAKLAIGASGDLLQSNGTIPGWSATVGTGSPIRGLGGTSWTPADGSGAALSFSSVSAQYSTAGNMVFAYANWTYPVTADATAASFTGLPVTVPNTEYARQCTLTYTNGAQANKVIPSKNATNASFYTATGSAVTNAQMSASSVYVMCIYPAS